MYVGDWGARGALYRPDKIAVVDVALGDEGRFTYRALNERANRLAGWLRAQGILKGDRVAMLAHNGVAYIDAFFACGKLGAILVPFNWRLHAREVAEVGVEIAPKVMIYSGEFAPLVAALLEDPRNPLTHLLHLDGEGLPGSLPYEQTVAAAPADPISEPTLTEEDIACLLFTGGTTGLPKGAMISYRQIAWNILNTMIHQMNRDDVTITHTPMFHTGGLLVYSIPLLATGGKVVIMRRWDPAQLLELIGREGVTMFFAVPTQFQQLYDTPSFQQTNFSRIRYVISGGAPLPVPLIHAWQQAHGISFQQGFGMTEFGPGIFSLAPEFAVSRAGSIGRPNYFVDVRLVDEEGRDVPTGEVGEILLRSPVMFSGYYGKSSATAEAIDAQGWFHTGDMARRDEEGFFFIADRKKDMFISGGENVYPSEIEKVLYEHPAVQLCSVIGVPDPKWGEVGKACVVLKAGAVVSEQALLDHLRGGLARYKVPKSVAFLEALPLSPAGKILKRELRERFQ